MIEHYNAFISYKHAPLDSKVASEIQKSLEHFRIPRAIQKRLGIKKIDRIFRDKEELLITSDLNQTIERALEHSDFLIVICSHAAKESVWVQREIEFFLKTHSKDQVLTVVVEGEPADVVPGILQEREVTVTLDSGEEESVLMPAEPLSCDYRGDFRKARKEELPRLVAAMLGCSYDELKQRQRQYRMRRMALVFAVVAIMLTGLSGYYAWSANQIQKNYLLSLQSQSQYLSAESVALLEQGDRINAMLLALEALPKDEEDPRPVLPEAEYALSQAVNAYVSPNANWYAVESAFPHGGQIDDFFVNQEETHLIVLHSLNTFTVWDVQSRAKLSEHVMPSGIRCGALSYDDKLLILSVDTLYCYDYRTDVLLWKLTASPYKGASGSPCVLGLSGNASLAALAAGDYLITLDTSTGQVLQEIPLPSYESALGDHTTSKYGIRFAKFSPDNRNIFLHLDGSEDYLAMCDLEEEVIRTFSLDFFQVDDAVFMDNGNVVFIGQHYLRNGTYWIDPLYYYEDAFSEVVCIASDGDVLWYNEIHYTEMSVGLGDELVLFDYLDEDGNVIPAIACTAGEKLSFFDCSTGEVLRENTYTAAIVTLTLYDTHFFATLTNGMIGQYLRSENQNMAASFCIEDIDMAWDDEHLFVSNSETGTVLLYTYDLHDENWVKMNVSGFSERTFWPNYHFAAGSTTLVSQSKKLDQPFITVDSQSRSAKYYSALPEEVWSDKVFLGLSRDGKALLFREYAQTDSIQAFDLETGEIIPEYYTMDAGESFVSSICPTENELFYISYNTDEQSSRQQYALTRQYSDGTFDRWYFSSADGYASFDDLLLPSPKADAVVMNEYFYNGNGRYYVLDLQTGVCSYTEPVTTYESLVAWASDGSMFFATDENCIRAFDRSGQEVYRFSCNGMTPESLFCSGENLMVLYGMDRIYRYQADSGAFLNKIDVDAGGYLSDCRWDNSNPGTLALYTDGTLNLIDTERWVVRTHVEDCIGFSLEEGLIFTTQRNESQELEFGYYEMYSYEDLIEMAKQQLGDTVLSAEMRAKYGVE